MDFVLRDKGDLSRTTSYLNKLKNLRIRNILEKYAKECLDALESATPVRTGLTAGSWNYEIEQGNGFCRMVFNNSNVNKGVNIALILDAGHGTGTGGWVEGLDYINPTLQPIFEEIAEKVKMEVSSV